MSVTRRTVLEQLAAISDATRGETTTVDRLATRLDADGETVEAHLHQLEACALAQVAADGSTRVTVTGEELLELPGDGIVVVDPAAPPSES
ncbi:MAG: hypothetical protein ABEJ35_04300 [Halobacteriaceae archaeon]